MTSVCLTEISSGTFTGNTSQWKHLLLKRFFPRTNTWQHHRKSEKTCMDTIPYDENHFTHGVTAFLHTRVETTNESFLRARQRTDRAFLSSLMWHGWSGAVPASACLSLRRPNKDDQEHRIHDLYQWAIISHYATTWLHLQQNPPLLPKEHI